MRLSSPTTEQTSSDYSSQQQQQDQQDQPSYVDSATAAAKSDVVDGRPPLGAPAVTDMATAAAFGGAAGGDEVDDGGAKQARTVTTAAVVEVNGGGALGGATADGVGPVNNSVRLRRLDDLDDVLTSADESELDPLHMRYGDACNKDIDKDAGSESNALDIDDDGDRWSKDFDRDSASSPTSHRRGSTIRCIIVGLLLLALLAGGITVAVLFFRKFQGEKTTEFKFASYFGNHMVLQRAPGHAIIWGYIKDAAVSDNTSVVVQLSNDNDELVLESRIPINSKVSNQIWKIVMAPVTAAGPFVITASLVGSGRPAMSIMLYDVVFGDVWFCVGQNRLHYSVDKLLNATADSESDSSLHDIRLFSLFPAKSDISWYDLRGIQLSWSVPRSIIYTTANNTLIPNVYFPAVCWLYGKQLHSRLRRPIGLVSVSYSDSLIDEWLPPSVIDSCGTRYTDSSSRIWNGMIHPLLDMPLYGIVWHQGSHDMSNAPRNYSCMMSGLIRYWRHVASERTFNSTDPEFPVGIVQLSPEGDFDFSRYAYTSARWQQTANYGFLPNPAMPRTFLAPTIDLPDATTNIANHSTFVSLHSRYKHDIVSRLITGALSVAYGEKDMSYKGPWPTHYSITPASSTRQITLYLSSTVYLQRHGGYSGFEVCCSDNATIYCHLTNIGLSNEREWITAQISTVSSTPSAVTLTVAGCGDSSGEARYIVALRYAWRAMPCTAKMCAIYASSSAPPILPMSPYVRFGLVDDGKKHALDPVPVELP